MTIILSIKSALKLFCWEILVIIGPYLYLWDLFPRLVLVIVASQVNHPTPVSRTEIVDLVGNNYTELSDTTGDPPPDLPLPCRQPGKSPNPGKPRKGC